MNNGRWNTKGRPVTYCSTVPSLCALEKRVHIMDPALLPEQAMVAYDLPDSAARRRIEIGDLPKDWTSLETATQRIGDDWLDSTAELLLFVPSVIVPIESADDRNVLINHRHVDARHLRISEVRPFSLDPRLFNP